MEAKDTVMSDKDWEAINQKAGVDVIGIALNLDGRYTPTQQAELIVARCDLAAERQAEISFKAGIRHTLSCAVCRGCLSTVDKKHGIHIPDKLYEELSKQAKLKEWGIKDDQG